MEGKKIQLDARGMGISNLKILLDLNNQLFHAMQITSLPTSLVVDNRGKVMLKIIGMAKWQELRHVILQYVVED